MKKILTSLFAVSIVGTLSAQWTSANHSTSGSKVKNREIKMPVKQEILQSYYKLDIASIRMQLKNAEEMGQNAKPVVVSIPTMDGKIEKFNVYSFPVVVKELADQYELGSYVGTAVGDPTQLIRFSVAPNDFQSMLFRNGQYEFIDPVDKSQGLYGVHPKTNKTGDKPFVCGTEEGVLASKDFDGLKKSGSSFTNNPSDFSKNSDKKYRTMRLAMSVTSEYTAYFSGVAGALAQINATMTRVNGVFEKDFALHLDVQNFPALIYTNAATDPYSDAAVGTAQANASNLQGWNLQLQNTLSNVIGNTAYDIGHLFGQSGGGGNAGCIGCVCINPTGTSSTNLNKGKGSGFTSPGNGNPSGDSFDIDYVAHELGHQLGANHTFSHGIEGSGVNMEPGSGSTIMGYAGITGANTDVQAHSDAYFHKGSIGQVQANLIAKNCDVEVAVTNNPPVIPSLPSYTIPNQTAFVLTAAVTDPENDPMTYTWEQVDSGMTAVQTIDKNNIGTTTFGASFRSVLPSTSPTRYFPKFSSVLAGVLDNSLNTWESTSQVARSSNFAITARDNNANISQQQTSFGTQAITVGNDGPFKITSTYLYGGAAAPITWDVVNTSSAPYNVTNVKIDYSTDNGVTWVVLLATTANDGTESVTMPASLNGQTPVFRVSAIGSVFYAVKKIAVNPQVSCGAAPVGVSVQNITINSALVGWGPVTGASSYSVQYKLASASAWTTVTSTTNNYTLTNLTDCIAYQVQVAAVCGGVTGAYSAPVNFSTSCVPSCTASSTSGQYNYIANMTIGTALNNTSVGSTYTDYTGVASLQPVLLLSNSYPISVNVNTTVAGASVNGMAVWIDFNKDGTFDAAERVLNMPIQALAIGPNIKTGNFTVPSTAVQNSPLRMRVVTVLMNSTGIGQNIPDSFACGSFPNGEVEDYYVTIQTSLGTSEVGLQNSGVGIYPNPATDVLNVTKVSEKAMYKIYSAAGQLVSSGVATNQKIDVSSLVKGVYVISISDKGSEVLNTKFIKK